MILKTMSMKRANEIVGSLLTEGYIIISKNACESIFSAYLRHHKNGNRVRVRASKREVTAWKNCEVIINETW